MAIDQQIMDYFDETAGGGDLEITQSMMDQWVLDGIRDVVSKIPQEFWDHFATLTAAQTADGYVSEMPIRVLRQDGVPE